MLRLQTRLRVDGITGKEIFDFLANPNDQAYQQWWPGTHLQLHPLKRTDDHVGDVIYMDEYIGERRVRMKGVVVEAVPEHRLVWQLRKVTKLPVRLSLDLTDDESGVAITHTIEAGFKGPGRLLDPLIRLYFSEKFAAALDEHVKTEFPLLRDRLPKITPEVGAR
jgi:uncharacterized protein YndB with AHSA1/START domain